MYRFSKIECKITKKILLEQEPEAKSPYIGIAYLAEKQ